jgi:N-hydroxyarylamine O-acetyltransferase
MDTAIDLEAYLSRIAYNGTRTPSYAALCEIQRRHVCTIPFENLDIHLGRPICIDLPAIEEKIVRHRRGGYCFEQNTLLQAALKQLGFTVRPLLARVRWQVPAEVETAKTHMLLTVACDGSRYLVDGGFGSGSLSAPLRLETEAEQVTPHEPRRVVQRDGYHAHQIRVADQWEDLYHFTFQPVLPIDYQMSNWFTSTWPQSRFRQNLIAARADEGVRYTLLNREFTIRWMDGRNAKREIASPDELIEVLAEYFALTFPRGTRFGPAGSAWPS